MDKVDILMQTMGSGRAVLHSYSDLVEDIPEVVVMTREELEVKIVGLLETFNDCVMIEISKYVRIHTELHSSGQRRNIMSLLKMKESEVLKEEKEEDVGPQEENPLQSQDFPAYTQSQGSDTVRVCKELEMHMESHPNCAECGKRFITQNDMKNHYMWKQSVIKREIRPY